MPFSGFLFLSYWIKGFVSIDTAIWVISEGRVLKFWACHWITMLKSPHTEKVAANCCICGFQLWTNTGSSFSCSVRAMARST